MQKMVRTDSSVPAGRLHAYMEAKPVVDSENITSLSALRWEPLLSRDNVTANL